MEHGLNMGMYGYDWMRGMQNRMGGGPMNMDANGVLGIRGSERRRLDTNHFYQ